jgi:hypothetical protein
MGVLGILTCEILELEFAYLLNSLLISTPIMSQETMKQNTNEFNARFGLREEIRPGTLDILTDTWNSAKAFLKTMKVEDLGDFRDTTG